MTNVAINGLGRIGRAALRTVLENDHLTLVAVNTPHPPEDLAMMLNLESAEGSYNRKVNLLEDKLIVDDTEYPVFHEKQQSKLPWKKLHVDVVFDCPESYSKGKNLKEHYYAGANKVMNWFDNGEAYITNMIRKTKGKLGPFF